MAAYKYFDNSCALFDDEETTDYKTNKNRTITDYQAENAQTLEKQEDIIRRTFEISNRILGTAQETEYLGIETAKQLKHQGDQLKNTNANLDKIQADLEVSERNIKGMRSLFKRMKCYIRGKAKNVTGTLKQSTEVIKKPSPLEPIIADSYQLTCDYDTSVQQSVNPKEINKDLNDMVDANTTQIYLTAVKLKEIAQAIGQEIDEQDTLLDTIQEKVERADIKIEHQTEQMKKLLKK